MRDEQTLQQGGNRLLAGVALVSFAALLLELSLTRLFSVVLFYHFAFLAISVALLGLGAGGVFAFVRRDWLERWSARQIASTVSATAMLCYTSSGSTPRRIARERPPVPLLAMSASLHTSRRLGLLSSSADALPDTRG